MAQELTVEALRYYVPLFQRGDVAFRALQDNDFLSEGERSRLEAQSKVRGIALERLVEISRPLMISEINSFIKGSLLKNEEDVLNPVFYAGVGGMVRGLRRFDVEKINDSATNYLFQWITTYAKKELLAMEAPFGIAPSRFQKYKKISAVRRKMEDELDRKVTNQEIYERFQSGGADVRSLNGPLIKKKVSAANRAISLSLIEEQEEFELKMKKVLTIDDEDFRASELLSYQDNNDEGLLSLFIKENASLFTEEAVSYLENELGIEPTTPSSLPLSAPQTRTLKKLWAFLIQDINGPFADFLRPLEKDLPEAREILSAMGEADITKDKYKLLFVEN